MRARYAAIAILAILVALLAGCTLTVTVDLTPAPAPTALATGTDAPTEMATDTSTATLAPTNTPMPPTNTPMPPTATPTPPPVQATDALTVNVPLLPVASGDPALDANNWASIAAGTVSPSGGYAWCRLVGAKDGARVYCQLWTPTAAGDSATLVMGTRTLAIAHDVPSGWQVGQRCGGTDGTGCRGWTAYAFLPWGQFGGAPQPGAIWPLSLTYHGATWAGSLRWGLPDYAGRTVEGAQVVTTTLSADAMLGGGTDCGAPAWPDYFPTWGGLAWPGAAQVTVQRQWDVADWPCYARYLMAWSLPALPAGAQVVSATVTLRQFGNAGYGDGYATDGTGDTVLEVSEVRRPWQVGATWDDAPPPAENISRATVRPIDATCPPGNLDSTRTCRPGVSVVLDVTAAVQRAVQDGREWASVMVDTNAGQYHAGKHFWARGTVEQPVVSIAYTLPGDIWTPNATPSPTTTTTAPDGSNPSSSSTPTPFATPTPLIATATSIPATASPSATPRPSVVPSPTTPSTQPTTGKTYYVATNGNDAAPGTAALPWRTFARAWQVMRPGDTLLIADGVYTEPLHVGVEGVAGAPITIKAVNDGKVTIDGQGQTIPIKLGDNWPGDNRSYITVEGIVAKNGTEAAVRVRGDHMVLRRVSAYDAGLRSNSAVMLVAWSSDVLLEDVIAAGTGRKSILIFTSERVTVRRAYTQWAAWDGQTSDTCAMGWPAGNGINPYNSKYVTVENALVTGPMADAALRITINEVSVYSPGMGVYGSIAVGAGMNTDGSRHAYPLVSDPQCYVPTDGPPYYTSPWGLGVWGQGDVPGPVFRDVLAYGNAGWGFASVKPFGAGVTGGVLDHATLCNNNAWPGQPQEVGQGTYSGFSVTNSQIPNFQSGEGARLDRRYVDGVRTDTPLLPWPMQARAAAELGVDVGAMWQRYAGACK